MNQKTRAKDLGYLFVVGGPGGSGSSTIAKMLAEHFSLKRVYGGKIFRSKLKNSGYEDNDKAYFKRNEQFLKKLDKQVDAILLNEINEPNILIESKNFAALVTKKKIPCTVRIWITASLHVRAQRSLMKHGINPGVRNLYRYFKTRDRLQRRYEIDASRYSSLYGINYNNPKEYNDIVIDSSHMNEKETFDLILKYIEDGGYIK